MAAKGGPGSGNLQKRRGWVKPAPLSTGSGCKMRGVMPLHGSRFHAACYKVTTRIDLVNKRVETAAVIGLGYVGLPTAALIAGAGIRVTGVDTRAEVVATINAGDVHIVEPGLEDAVRAVVRNGTLRAVARPEAADVFVIAVPTPVGPDHAPDVEYVRLASQSIAPVLRAGALVLLESTSPVGTTELVAEILSAARPDLGFAHLGASGPAAVSVAYCPERVLPGNALREMVQNDRVIGGLTPSCTAQAAAFYRCFVKGRCIETNARTAEMCKLTENSFRDVNIAFANELSLICDRLNINVWELISLANLHPRVNILQPGPGVGGHCIAVDPWFIVSQTPEQARLIRTAREVNDGKPAWVLDKIKAAVNATGKPEKQVVVACLGLSFKANIDDLRESPALDITAAVATAHSGRVLVVEPNIEALPARLAGGVDMVSLETALQTADVVVMLVDHTEFLAKPYQPRVGQTLVDTKGVWTHRQPTDAKA
jgi:UDP-N-acetyl-D-mannosaminuronic acid dehydrogenase